LNYPVEIVIPNNASTERKKRLLLVKGSIRQTTPDTMKSCVPV
jgi:hypothetical protein